MRTHIIKVSYANFDEAHTELSVSNPRFLQKIDEHLAAARPYIEAGGDTQAIVSKIDKLKLALAEEEERYTLYSEKLKNFVSVVYGTDQTLKTQFDTIFMENQNNATREERQSLIQSYEDSFFKQQLEELAGLGLSMEDLAALGDVQELVASFKNMTREEIEAAIRAKLKEHEGNPKALAALQKIKESLADPVDRTLDVADLAKDALDSYFYTLTPKAIDSLISAARSAKIYKEMYMNALYNAPVLEGLTDIEKATMRANRVQDINTYDALWNEADDVLRQTTRAKIQGAIITGIGIGLIVLDLAITGYKSIVVNGKHWEDGLQDVIAKAIGNGLSLAIGAIFVENPIPIIREYIVLGVYVECFWGFSRCSFWVGFLLGR